ncbi:radical SAM protein [Candidatus Woesearchaeota archaeon]|nr:radical SAM protein [Candidatus Woesearchaeota archaeon]
MAKKEFVWFDDRQVLDYLQSEEGRKNLLPAVSIASSPDCNMACPHCIYDAGEENEEALKPEEKVSLLEKAVNLGAKYLQICHDGEPILDPATLQLIEKASESGLKTFMYSNASLITPEIAQKLYKNDVCLGVHFDSLEPQTFDKMLGVKGGSREIYKGLDILLEAGYNQPTERDGKTYTRLGLVTTLTSINTENIEEIKDVARYAWDNNIFFGIARLEQGGRATGKVWNALKIPDKDKVISLVDWCSEQTGINYWEAQPTPYCIGVCGLQIADNGNVWMTQYGGSCDFTEPDGESFPERILTIGNVKRDSLGNILQRAWGFRQAVFQNGILDKKIADYERTKDVYPNGLQDCGSARTHTLFVPFYQYVKGIVEKL